ncbi:PHB depolymerase family esterase [Aminobacter anthyllidis]|uniref:PHB depolymerase family esterase n=1 Tax=Aminobacter anthyllidis TaxID=1035067 RepID=A0A9X1AH43_9HYPH|nr:PHB depolymerase family esterase [Aminobacter anthyllidis]MBT1159441.1 PHB depolymerase family esterase [Aminobacter anthyllidis]
MRNLSDTISRLAARRAQTVLPARDNDHLLSDLVSFGSNPGALRARTYLPENLPGTAPLVIVLHGCTQTAAGYNSGAGWSDLADREGFALLFPEQQRTNNANLCFNWFEPGDMNRNGGEPLSIRQMIEAMVMAHGLDRNRIFITGLSAGGAMTSVMLATYPEVFAGGAIIAGLPFGTANSIPTAFDRMRGHGGPSEARLQQLLRAASPHTGPWPTLSVWHGSADQIVVGSNADDIIGQWRTLHGIDDEATPWTTMVDGHSRIVWEDSSGREVIEQYHIRGMGHGTPLAADGIGAPGPFMIDAGISSTQRIAQFWQIADPRVEVLVSQRRETVTTSTKPARTEGIMKTIEDALRSAGLLR